jgi:uncharacterized protein (DUF736 family)
VTGDDREAMRERVRAADPEFTRLVDRLRKNYGEANVKVVWLRTNDGQEFGKVPEYAKP